MAKLTQANVDNAVTEAIESDIGNASKVKKALVLSLLFMAGPVGRPQPLSRLYMGVSKATADGILNYIRNLNFKYAEEIQLDTGKTVKVSFITFSASDKAFKHAKFGDEMRNEAAKAMRTRIAEMPEKQLLAIEMGRMQNRVEQAAKEFDAMADLAKFIKKAALNGASPAWLEQVNKLLDTEHRVDVKAESDKAKEAAESAIARAEKTMAQAQKARERLAMFNGEKKPEEVKPNGEAAKPEPAKAA